MKRQLFIITRETFNAISQDEIAATVEGLKEAEMFRLPFPEVDVWISGDNVTFGDYNPSLDSMIAAGLLIRDGQFVRCNYGDGHWSEYVNISLEHVNYQKWATIDKSNIKLRPSRRPIDFRYGDAYGPKEEERNAVANLLIVLLATRNAVKTTTHNKLAKHGIGKGVKKYEYVTTITVPSIMEDDEEHKPTGAERAPHLRRGHIRRQHYGVGNALIKMKWIDPVFVNADKGWVATRIAYRMG